MLFSAPSCRMCGSQITAHVRDIPLRRMAGAAPLYHCLECECFWHPQIYTEPDDQLQRDANWHISVEERNTRYSTNLLNAVRVRAPQVRSLIEIGCGTGTLLSVARTKFGMDAVGFDTNPYAPEIARSRHGIEIETRLWDRNTFDRKFDLVLCISTMEHVPDPNGLMAEIAAYCAKHGSIAFVSVPFTTEKEHLHHLAEEAPSSLQNPFYLVDVHINHFSHKGFEKMAQKHGAKVAEFWPRGWYGYWLEF